jgi:hypothetical protein
VGHTSDSEGFASTTMLLSDQRGRNRMWSRRLPDGFFFFVVCGVKVNGRERLESLIS